MTDWITTKEAAELSWYEPDYIRDLAREGKITARKVATVWLVSRRSLTAHGAQTRRDWQFT